MDPRTRSQSVLGPTLVEPLVGVARPAGNDSTLDQELGKCFGGDAMRVDTGMRIPVRRPPCAQIALQELRDETQHLHSSLTPSSGDAVISWKVINAFPTKLEAPAFDASSNDVAIESMELMADSVTIEAA